MEHQIRHVAVIGSGVMGGGIAAHVANAGLPVTLLDIAPFKLTPQEEAQGLGLNDPRVKNRIVMQGFQGIVKGKPPALFSRTRAELIRVGNLEDNLDWLSDADLLIEVVLENLDIKRKLFEKIGPHIKPTAIVGTNTSGIPISEIAAQFSEDLKRRFVGTHFFNPPRWLKLLEIVPTADTEPLCVERMSAFGELLLGKGVVLCKDSPNFIANRIGAFDGSFMLDYALNHGYSIEEIDAIAGPLMGRPKTAVFKLADLVGLDVNFHVLSNLYPAIAHDPAREVLRSAKPMGMYKDMVEKGLLGRKAKQGFYRMTKGKGGKKIFEVIDLETMEYRPEEKPVIQGLKEAKAIGSLAERLRHLVNDQGRLGALVWNNLGKLLAYASTTIPEITDNLYSIDNAMKWGYGHDLGPFEVWDALGVAPTMERMEAEGLTVAPWVKEMLGQGIESFYADKPDGMYCYDIPSKSLQRMPLNPDIITLKSRKKQGGTILSNPSASLVDMGDGVACLEFHSKMNALDQGIVEMINQSVAEVERNFTGMVVGNQGGNFSVGANILMILGAAKQQQWDQIHQGVAAMHQALGSLRFCARPVVAAPFGMALGGGAEVAMQADRACAAGDLFMGLVEVGVGLIPGGGGCKELLRRMVSPVMARTPHEDPLALLQHAFTIVAQAKVTTSALEAQEWGFLAQTDSIVMNKDLLLDRAKKTVLYLDQMDYVPPVPGKVYAVGRKGLGALKAGILAMRSSGFITGHDVTVASKLAEVLCGGNLPSPQWVDEQYILDLEREAFVSLCGEPKTQDRIEHMLKTNKPLRN